MENDVILRENIYNQILKIEGAKDVYKLFGILGFPEAAILDPSSKRKKSTFEFKKDDLVEGTYKLPISKGKRVIAVKIIDMLGKEIVITKEI